MTDIEKFLANGGVIKKGKTKVAKGSVHSYDPAPGIKRINRKPPTPKHMAGTKVSWLKEEKTYETPPWNFD